MEGGVKRYSYSGSKKAWACQNKNKYVKYVLFLTLDFLDTIPVQYNTTTTTNLANTNTDSLRSR